ncbi:MAG: hypothetical protein LAN18_15495 [Acidobacteriia bacterium]|nr:hypothetical protein [Terriglobia bacterium]
MLAAWQRSALRMTGQEAEHWRLSKKNGKTEHVYEECLCAAKKWSYRHRVINAELFATIGAAYFSPFL